MMFSPDFNADTRLRANLNRVFQIQVRPDFRKSQLTPAGPDGTATLRQGDATAPPASLSAVLMAG